MVFYSRIQATNHSNPFSFSSCKCHLNFYLGISILGAHYSDLVDIHVMNKVEDFLEVKMLSIKLHPKLFPRPGLFPKKV